MIYVKLDNLDKAGILNKLKEIVTEIPLIIKDTNDSEISLEVAYPTSYYELLSHYSILRNKLLAIGVPAENISLRS